ncbi:MAG: hypothetical protein NTX61_06350 [Bacteroidetes bacterium]|nr:hypothetical protein [Bacteroidota bacterium]
MKPEYQRITHSFYEAAPEMLLDKIAEVNGILAKQKARTGETESYLFWSRVSDVMKFAWDYFQDLKWVNKKNELLEMENRFLKEWCRQLSSRLETYEVIREAKLNGKFEEAVQRVNEHIFKTEQQQNTIQENEQKTE